MANESFIERLDLLREKVRNCAQAQCPVNLNECCVAIHRDYIWLRMNDNPLARQFQELLYEAQDALSDIKQQSNFQTT